jgi:hypothetical protein
LSYGSGEVVAAGIDESRWDPVLDPARFLLGVAECRWEAAFG